MRRQPRAGAPARGAARDFGGRRLTARLLAAPPGVPLMDALARAALDGAAGPLGFEVAAPGDPLALADLTVYVPTPRQGRALAAAFARAAGDGGGALLPRIAALGEEAGEAPTQGAEGQLRLPFEAEAAPAVEPVERRFALMRLVAEWAAGPVEGYEDEGDRRGAGLAATPAAAFASADALAALIDEFHQEGVPWERVRRLAGEEFDRYWLLTADFLRLAAERWPARLRERGLCDASARRDALLRAEAERLERERPEAPVLALAPARATPAAAALLGAVARLPRGAVVLPGLDLDLDEASWERLAERTWTPGEPEPSPSVGHAQAGLRRLLDAVRAKRADARWLAEPPEALRLRTRAVAEALRPADTTDGWPAARRALAEGLAEGLEGLSLVEAADEREEALAAALALREALEDPAVTAALITPDRGLLRRVGAELERWGVVGEVAGGRPLAEAPRGALARLAASAVAERLAPAAVLALLGHPLVTLGRPRAEAAAAARTLEVAALRGAEARPGAAGLREAIEAMAARVAERHAPAPRVRLTPEALAAAADLGHRLLAALDPLERALDAGPDLAEALEALAAALTALTDDGAGAATAFDGEDGAALAGLADEVERLRRDAARVTRADLPAVLDGLLADRAVPAPAPTHPRLKLWTPAEARGMSVDVAVLGGLDEGVWPPDARSDAFLNRPMRAELGLGAPERRIGQAAHDFVTALGAPRAVLTRARSRGGAPAVASRVLRRLRAFAGGLERGEAALTPGARGWEGMVERGDRLLALARAVDRAPPVPRAPRPCPRPPVRLRPDRLSVTEVETLIRDPYAVHARRVLRLDPLEPLRPALGAAARGTIVHEALARFAHGVALEGWPEDPAAALTAIGREVFAPHAGRADVAAFWWPRFEAAAAYYLGWEEARRASLSATHAEVAGRHALVLASGRRFTLSARADRIDVTSDGALVVLDYKTGTPPSSREVEAGLAPQLTLTAAMAARGAFGSVPAAPAAHLAYLRLHGGGAGGEEVAVKGDAAALAEAHMEGLVALLNAYEGEETGYPSRLRAKFKDATGPYDHLARVREWSLGGEDGAGEAA